jgi:hypothetical protein
LPSLPAVEPPAPSPADDYESQMAAWKRRHGLTV